MLDLTLLGEEEWDEDACRFRYPNTVVLTFEHSLVSLSKWEALREKPFLGPDEKTPEEMVDYIRCMLLTPNVPDEVLDRLSEDDLQAINAYINRPMTGTTFSDVAKAARGEVISAELVYYWMNTAGIPKDHETWHLNRLFTLIRVHSVKSQKPKKLSPAERKQQQRELNAKRQAQMQSKG